MSPIYCAIRLTKLPPTLPCSRQPHPLPGRDTRAGYNRQDARLTGAARKPSSGHLRPRGQRGGSSTSGHAQPRTTRDDPGGTPARTPHTGRAPRTDNRDALLGRGGSRTPNLPSSSIFQNPARGFNFGPVNSQHASPTRPHVPVPRSGGPGRRSSLLLRPVRKIPPLDLVHPMGHARILALLPTMRGHPGPHVVQEKLPPEPPRPRHPPPHTHPRGPLQPPIRRHPPTSSPAPPLLERPLGHLVRPKHQKDPALVRPRRPGPPLHPKQHHPPHGPRVPPPRPPSHPPTHTSP